MSGAAGLRGAGCAGRAPRGGRRAGRHDTAIKGSAPPVLCCWVATQGRDGRSGVESGCFKENRKRQTKSKAHVKGVLLPRLRRGSIGSRALPGWEAGLGAEDRQGKGGSLLTGCRDEKKWRLPSPSVFTLGTQPGGEDGCARRRDTVPWGIAAGRAGLPGPHGPPAASTEPCRQPGRRRGRSLPPVPAALPPAAAAPPLRPLRRRLRAPRGTPRGTPRPLLRAERPGWAGRLFLLDA